MIGIEVGELFGVSVGEIEEGVVVGGALGVKAEGNDVSSLGRAVGGVLGVEDSLVGLEVGEAEGTVRSLGLLVGKSMGDTVDGKTDGVNS